MGNLFSQAVSAVFSVLIFYIKLPDLRCRRNDCKWDKSLIQKTLHFSIVTSIHQASLYIGKLMVQSAGKQDRVKKGFWDSLVLLFSLGIVCSVILYLVSPNAVVLILGHTYGAAYQNAVSYLRIIAFFYTFCFTGNTFAGYLDGIKKVSIPFIGAAGHIALRVILSWIFIQDYQLSAVAFATGIGWVLVNLFWAVYQFVFCHKRA